MSKEPTGTESQDLSAVCVAQYALMEAMEGRTIGYLTRAFLPRAIIILAGLEKELRQKINEEEEQPK